LRLSLTFLALVVARTVSAHPTNLSYLDLNVDGVTVHASLDVPATDLVIALDLDSNHDGRVDDADVAARQDALTGWLASALTVQGDALPCSAAHDVSQLQSNAQLTIRAVFHCSSPVKDLAVHAQFAEAIGEGFSTFVHVHAGEIVRQTVVTSSEPSASFSLVAGTAWTPANVGRFIGLGMAHILTGADHILFLIALLMMGGTLRRIIIIATAFTAAHTITLTLAALDKVHLPGRFVECAIAASIAYVAVENFWHANPPSAGREPFYLRSRWVVTFVFGLVHGFGFASALGQVGLTRDELPPALACFNIGVELGQVVIITLAYPFLKRASQQTWYRPNGVRCASAAVFAIALYWFVLRLVG